VGGKGIIAQRAEEFGSGNAEGERAEGVKLGRWEGEKGNWNSECGLDRQSACLVVD
jgi:hypothetical protein